MAELRARLRFRQSHHADLRLGKHRGRNVGVVDLNRTLAEYCIRKGVALADRDRRQVNAMGDIPDRVNVRHRGLRETIDRAATIVRVDSDAHLLKPEIGDTWMP